MSRTLFWYILRDLLKIFLMASGVLAGIMSFGGLFKPMTKFGLSGAQMLEMLACLMPAMQTYSLPIAALFATTVVYGRLSADNELTACRASGISHLSMAMPAFVLGLVLALLTLGSLSLLVPYYTLKAEKVVFESVAEVIQKNIQQSHQVRYPGLRNSLSIYADRAEVVAPPADRPGEEVVVLYNPVICTMDQNDQKQAIPSDFYAARSAVVVIRQGEGQAEFLARLQDGVKFSRDLTDATGRGGVGSAQVGPIQIPSVIKENTKFMNVRQLNAVLANPLRSLSIRQTFEQLTRQEQQRVYLQEVEKDLKQRGRANFAGADGESYVLQYDGSGVSVERLESKLVMRSADDERSIKLKRVRDGRLLATDEAHQVTLRVQSDPQVRLMRLEFALQDVLIGTPDGRPGVTSFARPFSVELSPELVQIGARTAAFYENENLRLRRGEEAKSIKDLRSKLATLQSGVTAELNARASFAISCLILVMVGSALGMMFKTANYLSAFSLSVIPALVCIALIVTGQHLAENDAGGLGLGLAFIWGGNVLVLIVAVVLLGRLQRE